MTARDHDLPCRRHLSQRHLQGWLGLLVTDQHHMSVGSRGQRSEKAGTHMEFAHNASLACHHQQLSPPKIATTNNFHQQQFSQTTTVTSNNCHQQQLPPENAISLPCNLTIISASTMTPNMKVLYHGFSKVYST